MICVVGGPRGCDTSSIMVCLYQRVERNDFVISCEPREEALVVEKRDFQAMLFFVSYDHMIKVMVSPTKSKQFIGYCEFTKVMTGGYSFYLGFDNIEIIQVQSYLKKGLFFL